MLSRPALCLLLICASLRLTGQSQWTPQNNGLFGGQVTALTSGNGNLFAGTYDGVYRSQNNGANWGAVNNGLNGKSINDLTTIGNTVYIAINAPGGGNFSSTDNGDSWNSIDFGAPIVVVRLVTIGSQLFALDNVHSLYTYTGSGPGTIVNHGVANVYDVAASGSNLFLASASGLYVSTNLGLNWNPINLGVGTYSAQTVRANGNKVVAWIAYGGFNHSFISMDGGANWFDSGQGPDYGGVGALDNGAILVGSSSGPAKVSTNGTSWSTLIDLRAMTSFVSTAGGQFAGTSDGVFRAMNGGTSWVATNAGLMAHKIETLTVRDKKIFAASEGKIFISGDGALSWTEITGIALGGGGMFRCLTTSGSNILVGASVDTYGSPDDGATWFTASPHLGNVISFVTIGPNLYAANPDGVYVSSDNGRNWTLLASYSQATSLSTDGTNIFVTSTNGAVRIAPTGVMTTISNGLPSGTLVSIASVGNKLICGTINDGLYVSGDAGVSWNHVSGMPSYNTGRVLFVNGPNAYAALDGFGVYLSSDMGATWTSFNSGFDPILFTGPIQIQSMISFEGRLLAGVAGVWSICATPKPTITTSIVNQSQVLSVGGGSALNQWFFNGGPSAIGTGLTFTPTLPGHYSAKVIYPNGCSSATSDEIVFSPCATMTKPVISGTGLNSPTPRLTSSSAADNQWYLNGELIFGATTPVYDPVQPGTYTVKVLSAALGCFRTSDDFVVTCAMPTPVISISGDGGTQFVSSSATGNQWYLNGVAINGATASKIAAMQSGVYTVTVSVTAVCSRSSQGVTFTGDLTTNPIANGISIFPNPAADVIYVDLDGQKFHTGEPVHVTIIDSIGRLITAVEAAAGDRVPVDVSGYSSGMYLLRAAQGGEKRVVRFVKGK